MYLLIQSYLERLPGATNEVERADGTRQKECVYTPHSLIATAHNGGERFAGYADLSE
jgi:hypothetical protein